MKLLTTLLVMGIISTSNAQEVFTTRFNTPYLVSPNKINISINSFTKISYYKELKKLNISGEACIKTDTDSITIVAYADTDTRILLMPNSIMNISAYSADSFIRLSLYRGAAYISRKGKNYNLVNGRRFSIIKNAEFYDNHDVEGDTAWTIGEFHFNGDPISQILTRLERHYPVEFRRTFEQDVIIAGGGISLKKPIEEILMILSLTKHLAYSRNGRYIYILSK